MSDSETEPSAVTGWPVSGHDWPEFAALVGQLPAQQRNEWLAAWAAGRVTRGGGTFERSAAGPDGASGEAALSWGRFAEVLLFDQDETDDRPSLDANVTMDGFYQGARLALADEPTA